MLRLIKDETIVNQLKEDWQHAQISNAEKAMLAYSVKLTREPWSMEENDVIALRDVGFTDTDILDINQIAGYYAYVNRLADGLGVELEKIWQETE